MSPAPLTDTAEEAFYSRAKGDSALTTIIGGTSADSRIFHEDDVSQELVEEAIENRTPLLVYRAVVEGLRWRDVGEPRLQIDMIAPEKGDEGGWSKVKAMDERLLELFDDAHFDHGGVQVHGLALGARRLPVQEGMLGRTRDYELGVGP